jgi:hypothetical protein
MIPGPSFPLLIAFAIFLFRFALLLPLPSLFLIKLFILPLDISQYLLALTPLRAVLSPSGPALSFGFFDNLAEIFLNSSPFIPVLTAVNVLAGAMGLEVGL